MHDDTNNHYTQMIDQFFYSVQHTIPPILASAKHRVKYTMHCPKRSGFRLLICDPPVA